MLKMLMVHNPCVLNNFRKYQRNKNKFFSQKRNSIIKDDKVGRAKS